MGGGVKEGAEEAAFNLRLTGGGGSQPGVDQGREPKEGKEFTAAENLRGDINDV